MMDAILAVGVPHAAGTYGGEFDLWLPVYIVLAFVLVRFMAGMRLSLRSSIAAFLGGNLWSSSVDSIGVIPAAALAVLVAFAAGEIRRRRPRTRPSPD